jgi:hypothetical protein
MVSLYRRRNADSSRLRTMRQAIIAIVSALVLILQCESGQTRAQVSGYSYSSPQFGYTISWDPSWFVIDEESFAGSFDFVAITNGVSAANFFGESNTYPNYESGLATYITGFNSDPGISDFTTMNDDQGNVIRETDEKGARAAFTFTYSSPDGTQYPMAVFMEVYGLDSNAVLFGYWVSMPLEAFEAQHTLDGVDLPGDTPDPAALETSTGVAPEFISEPWRIAVTTSSLDQSFPELGLRTKNGKAWLVLVLDVTNWSDSEATLSALDFAIQSGTDDKPIKAARKYIAALAEHFGTSTPLDNLTFTIHADETLRITLPFVVTAKSSSLTLNYSGESLRLDNLVKRDLETVDLPEMIVPPVIAVGAIESVSDGKTIQIRMRDNGELLETELIGVGLADKSSCHADDAEAFLQELIGTTVLIEKDEVVTRGSVPARYVWVINEDRTRTLLNQRLIQAGMTYSEPLDGNARFSEWFQTTADEAKAASLGVWQECTVPGSDGGILMILPLALDSFPHALSYMEPDSMDLTSTFEVTSFGPSTLARHAPAPRFTIRWASIEIAA